MASNKTKATIGGALNLNGKTQVTKPKRPSPRRSIVDEGEDEKGRVD